MGCCEENQNPDEKLVHDGSKSIKERKRHCCTDLLFLIAIICCWIAMTLLGFVAIGWIQDDRLQPGDYRRLVNSIDYAGNVCGASSSVKDKPYGYYMLDGSVVCVDTCPKEADYSAFICRYDKQDDADASASDGYHLVAEYECMYEITTRKFLNRCFPNMNVTEASVMAAQASGGVLSPPSYYTYVTGNNKNLNWFNNFIGDMYILRSYVFGFGLGISTIIAFVYLNVLRIPFMLRIIIWTCILTIFVMLWVGSFLLWDLSHTWRDDGEHSRSEYRTMQVISYIGMAVASVYTLLIFVLRKRIALAIGIVKEAAKALIHMPALIFVPVFQAIGIACFLIPWIIYLMYLASSGDMKTHVVVTTVNSYQLTYAYRTFSYNKDMKYLIIYMIFCWFWTSEFIIGVGQLIIAASFSDWYFTRDKKQTGVSTVCWASSVIFFHHLGTAAFGSLILAVIRTIRTVVMYLQKKAEKSGNSVLKYALCCVTCFLKCLDSCIKFINKHAYIMTAIYGDGFCSGSFRAFHLLLRNIMRVGCVSMIGNFVLLIGKLFVPVVTVFVCYLTMAYSFDSSEVSGIIGPLVVVFILAYFISAVFSEIFGMGIETILYCFIADEEMFKVEDRYAEAELVGTLFKTAQAHREMKAKKLGKDNATDGGNAASAAADGKAVATGDYSAVATTTGRQTMI